MPRLHDLRRKFRERMLKPDGVWVVYTRSDPRFRCTACFDLDRGSATRQDCGTCFGTGYRVTLERWKVYSSHSIFRARTSQDRLTWAGWTAEHSPVVFTQAADVPRPQDRIFLVEWDRTTEDPPYGAQPTRIAAAFEVSFVEPLIAGGGVVYYTCHTQVADEARAAYEHALLPTPIQVTRLLRD